MRKIKNGVSYKGYRTESKFVLKLKELVRECREKRLFYLEHSKFATYVPKDYLNVFKEEIIEFSKAWIRMQQKNMASEKEPGIEGHANTRGLHVLDTAINASQCARELLLNEDLAFAGAAIHDIAHTSFAHEGEHILSKYLQKEGICEVHHSSLSRLMLEIEQIHKKCLERLEQIKGRPLTKRELKMYKTAYLNISDIAVCHNGESNLTEVAVNRNKTDADIEQEHINTYIYKGLDSQTRNRTKEGAIVLFCDPISYVAKDFRDGIFKGVVDVDDSQYENIFIKMGLKKEELDRWNKEGGKKDKIVAWVTRRLRDNLIQNSQGIDGARMDKELGLLMYDLRSLNYDKVVKPGLRKINDILADRIEMLIDKYSDILIQYESEKVNENLDLNAYRHKMIKKFTTKKSEDVEEIYEQIVKKGIEENLRNEVKTVLEGEKRVQRKKEEKEAEEEKVRIKRIEEDRNGLKKEYGKISEDIKENYIQRLLKEIYLSPKESKELFLKRIKIKYPEASDEEIENLAKKNEYLRLKTYTECLAKMKVAIYIGESSNDYLLDMLQEEQLITQEERDQRYQLGANIENSSITETIRKQQEENDGKLDGRG